MAASIGGTDCAGCHGRWASRVSTTDLSGTPAGPTDSPATQARTSSPAQMATAGQTRTRRTRPEPDRTVAGGPGAAGGPPGRTGVTLGTPGTTPPDIGPVPAAAGP